MIVQEATEEKEKRGLERERTRKVRVLSVGEF
jgi:hypothetical protein